MQLLPLLCVEKGAGLMITIEAILLKDCKVTQEEIILVSIV